MNKSSILGFVLGALTGAGASYFVTKKMLERKYEDMANKEISEMRDYFLKNSETLTENVATSCEKAKLESVVNEIIDSNGYSENSLDEDEPDVDEVSKSYISDIVENCSKEPEFINGPYPITATEFGEDEDLECVTLLYFSDGILTDIDEDPIIENLDLVVGLNNLKRFEDERVNEIYIRSRNLNMDIEIVRDLREYGEVHPEGAYIVRDAGCQD